MANDIAAGMSRYRGAEFPILVRPEQFPPALEELWREVDTNEPGLAARYSAEELAQFGILSRFEGLKPGQTLEYGETLVWAANPLQLADEHRFSQHHATFAPVWRQIHTLLGTMS